MSGARDFKRTGRPPKMYLISTEQHIQENHILLLRGTMCVEKPLKSRGEFVCVKVLENAITLSVERRALLEVPSDFVGLLEPVEPETRLKLLSNPQKLYDLASLPIGTPLWVRTGPGDDFSEAELKYFGPLTPGSRAQFFGVQLLGSAAGKGKGTGNDLFTCPDGSAIFLPISHIKPRHRTRSPEGQDRQRQPRRSVTRRRTVNIQTQSNGHHAERLPLPPGHHSQLPPQPQLLGVLHGATEQSPAATLRVGQRVSMSLEGSAVSGEVRFCGPLPGRSSSETYVGVLLDTPVGDWDGVHKGEKLCQIPYAAYGKLLPASEVFPESQHPKIPPPQVLKSVMNTLQTTTKPLSMPASAPKVALLPPNKKTHKPVPPPPRPKLVHNHLPPPPPPPPKPAGMVAAIPAVHPTNGMHSPPSSPRSADVDEAAVEHGEILEVGSMVEVNDPPLYGVIRWIGNISGVPEVVAGIELEQELAAGTDGRYLNERHFRCPPNKGLFVKLSNCRRDSRFPAPEARVNQVERCNSIAFAEWGSERVEDHTPPMDGDEAKELYQGWKRGIQGHLNSCYLDATLFSLFSCCSSADWLLFWPSEEEEDQSSSRAQDLLRCEIVNPLRRYGYVCASKTMALRRLLEAANRNAGFTNQEKDPEEFLNKLFQLLQVEPLLKIRSMTQKPQECHLYQLFPPHAPASSSLPSSPHESPVLLPSPLFSRMKVASVQALLESSFLHAGLKFVEAPSCLLLLMPRFGKDFKMFDAILPTLHIDITDLLDDTLRQCSICQAVARWECVECYEDRDITPGHLKQYCHTCNTQVHNHRKRGSHSPVEIGIPEAALSGPNNCARQQMSLFAVTCIETSHYVSFVKYGPQSSDWLFFDSMADREGGENGFNVPLVKPCPEVGGYFSLSEEELGRVDPASFREPARRLLCDSYMCLYHNPELSLYK
ncbi:ubiquitin carboxyl-terminal hydrolase CYLD isoform X2 [Dunckerocampus dactyliophorus]|uniref:ubiquitin carboxyl-terminal hydrolase CYLD isoform X2 n=1 Tax=Dunckerocampus dactyliophorus TaxID=161453 RepID=UPI0024057D89|nr:ubiquitin carboxyl-terminal hydrolase CYLD isoform X2 [Dunckerocampus dactyliophorus]